MYDGHDAALTAIMQALSQDDLVPVNLKMGQCCLPSLHGDYAGSVSQPASMLLSQSSWLAQQADAIAGHGAAVPDEFAAERGVWALHKGRFCYLQAERLGLLYVWGRHVLLQASPVLER